MSIIAVISTLEYFNCLMFIQADAPYNEYCIIMCLVPFIVTCITEIQFIAYMQLLTNRLKLINDFLGQFRDGAYGNATKHAKMNINKHTDWQQGSADNKTFNLKQAWDTIKIQSSSEAKKKHINRI